MARKYKAAPGTWVEREMFESKAFINLRGFAPQLLVWILGKRQFSTYKTKNGKEKKICTNRDSINFTYIEAKKFGVSKPRFTRGRDDLLAKGFIKTIHPGGCYKQDKAIYGLSDNWILWQPEMVFETRSKSDVQRGYCKPKKQK